MVEIKIVLRNARGKRITRRRKMDYAIWIWSDLIYEG